MMIVTDDEYNNLDWEPLDGMKVNEMVEGLTALGAEPTDYPETDAITFFFRDRNGDILVIDTGADIFNTGEDENPFYVNVARVKR